MDVKLKGYQQVFILLVTLYSLKLEAATTGLIPAGRQCACVGDRLIYNCNVIGGTTTLWKGSLLDCPMDGSLITLRHSLFESNQAFGICNNGNISGRGIGVVNNCYISQLNVTVRESFDNKTVQCVLNSIEGTKIVGESLLRVVPATNPYPPPDNIHLVDVQPGKLIFNWSSVISYNCSILQYSIASDCGTCPTVTNTTTTTCTDLQLTTNSASCNFRVSSHACDLVGNPSSPILVTLKVPNVPQVELIPSYSNDSRTLQKLFIISTMNQTEDLFDISEGISGSPTTYTTHASNLTGGTSFNSTVDLSSCDGGSRCQIEIRNCSQSTIINISISTANKLGEGPRSNPFMIECTNNFVQVVYKKTSESTISCVFLNLSDTSEKTCCLTYQLCDQIGPQKVQECNKNSPYNIQLELSGRSSKTHCYTVTASNDTYTMKVEGTFILDDNHRESVSTAAVAAGVIVSFIFVVLLLLGTGLVVWVVIRAKKKTDKYSDSALLSDISPPNLKPLGYLIPYRLPDTLELHYVGKSDCELRDFITEVLGLEFRRGHTYYEFTNEVEDILEGKEVLLQDKKSEKWFRLDKAKVLAAGRHELYGEARAWNNFGEQYRVFIQSFGSGARHLARGSYILYHHSDDQVQPDVLPLVPVYTEHFAHKVIEEECTVQQFCMQNRLNPTAFNMFLSVEHLPEGMRCQPPRDVILMNRESKELFTGPFGRQMLDLRNRGELQNENEKWKAFALLEKNKQGLVLKKGSEVLYQDSKYQTGNYDIVVLDVDEGCVRMSKFIETKLNCKFEDKRAFYEATETEDLLYYKKVLRPQTNKLGCEELKLQSLIEYFYAIPGVPSVAVKLSSGLHHHKIFIQSTSQGSRCLKKGTKLLYLKEYIKSHPIDAQADDHSEIAGSS